MFAGKVLKLRERCADEVNSSDIPPDTEIEENDRRTGLDLEFFNSGGEIIASLQPEFLKTAPYIREPSSHTYNSFSPSSSTFSVDMAIVLIQQTSRI